MIITGSNLTDLGRMQTALAENDTRERIAQAQAQQAAEQARQERYFRGQQMQAQQQDAARQDALARAQLAQQGDIARATAANADFFNRGRLTNEGKSLEAQIAQGQVALSEAEKDRSLKRELNRNPTDWHSQQLSADLDAWDSAAEAAANKFNTQWGAEQKAQAATAGQTQKQVLDKMWWNTDSDRAKSATAVKDSVDAFKDVGFSAFLNKINSDPDANKVVWENGVAKPKKIARPSFFNRTSTSSGMPQIDSTPITAPSVALPPSGGYWNSPVVASAPVAAPSPAMVDAPRGMGYFNSRIPAAAVAPLQPAVDYQTAVKLLQQGAQSGKITRDDYVRMRAALDLQFGAGQ